MNSSDKTIIVASGNQGKINEFQQALEPAGYSVKSLKDFPDFQEPAETGTTYAENAIIKAQAVTDKYNVMAVADDSGLEIKALNSQPGIFSARWLGHDTAYRIKNKRILELMQGQADRNCRYICDIAVTMPDKQPVVFEGIVYCKIAEEAAGNNGFAYDPIVFYPPLHKTMAELSAAEKNQISHRGKAIRLLQDWLRTHKEEL